MEGLERLVCLQGRPVHRSIDAACILEQENPADARVTRDSAIVPRWPPAFILNFKEPQIGLATFDPMTPKTITNQTWSRPDAPFARCSAFKLYCDLETGVLGHSRSSKATLFDRAQSAHTTLYSSSITVSENSRILVENCYTPCIWRPRWGWSPQIFARTLGDEKLEWWSYQVVKKFRWCVQPFWHKSRVWQTDRNTELA